MRKIILFVLLLLLKSSLFAQNYEVLNYNFNSTPTYGVKIKTNLPYTSSTQMPTIHINGYNYATGNTINLDIVWYIYDNQFHSYGASSSGGYTPKILLSNENGKVVIFIDDRSYYQRFKVSVFAGGMSEPASWFSGWTTADEALTGTNTVEVIYNNKLGNVSAASGNNTSTLYNAAAIELRESKYGGGSFLPPRLSFHWGGVVASQIGIESSGSIAILNNPGTGYENFIARVIAARNDNNGGYISLSPGSATQTGYLGVHKSNGTRLGYIGYDNINLNYVTENGANHAFYGNVGIGTANIGTMKLAVEGNIGARKVIVTQASPWPDYVFHKDYKLPTLEEIEKYIKLNKHLPDVPSAKEVEKNGIDLGDNQALLLKKIEELTLFVIELDKQNKNLQERFAQLTQKQNNKKKN